MSSWRSRVRGAVPERVLEAFEADTAPRRLKGGEGCSWLAGDTVLKPCDAEEEWCWLGTHLPTVEQKGFRLSLPLKARDGRWVVDGWSAQNAVTGSHPEDGRWVDVLELSEVFHRAAAHLPRPPIDGRTHPWLIGDRVAWGDDAKSDSPLIAELLGVRRPLELKPQLIHSDLTENVLFSEEDDPAIIDMTPYWRPAGYASAVIVADAICWRSADSNRLLPAVAHLEEFPQLLLRALVFRMTVTLELEGEGASLARYRPATDLALRLVDGR